MTAPPTTFADLDSAVKHCEDQLLAHVHSLAQKWLVDPAARKIWIRTMLHDSVTATTEQSDGSVGPNQLLRWASKCQVPKGHVIFGEGDDDDGLYLLYRGQVLVTSESPPSRQTVYPGAFFNEHVLLSQETGCLYTATAMADSVMLSISPAQLQQMQWAEPHLAFQLVLSIFRQADLRQPHRRHATHNAPMNAKALSGAAVRKTAPGVASSSSRVSSIIRSPADERSPFKAATTAVVVADIDREGCVSSNGDATYPCETAFE